MLARLFHNLVVILILVDAADVQPGVACELRAQLSDGAALHEELHWQVCKQLVGHRDRCDRLARAALAVQHFDVVVRGGFEAGSHVSDELIATDEIPT